MGDGCDGSDGSDGAGLAVSFPGYSHSNILRSPTMTKGQAMAPARMI